MKENSEESLIAEEDVLKKLSSLNMNIRIYGWILSICFLVNIFILIGELSDNLFAATFISTLPVQVLVFGLWGAVLVKKRKTTMVEYEKWNNGEY